MANKITVTISGTDYTLMSEDSPSYMQKVGAYVGDKMDEVLNSTRVGKTDAAVLTAANIADELFKAQAAYQHAAAPVGEMMRKHTGYVESPPYNRILKDIAVFLNEEKEQRPDVGASAAPPEA